MTPEAFRTRFGWGDDVKVLDVRVDIRTQLIQFFVEGVRCPIVHDAEMLPIIDVDDV
jgi:hypothetical protein